VAPEVRNTRLFFAAMGAAASTMSVSEKPISPATAGSCLMSAAVSRVMTGGLVSPSRRMSLTGRPSTPPALLASSTASCAPRDDGTSRSSCPPVRLYSAPMTIGLSAARAVRARAAKAMRTAAAVVVRREFAMTPL